MKTTGIDKHGKESWSSIWYKNVVASSSLRRYISTGWFRSLYANNKQTFKYEMLVIIALAVTYHEDNGDRQAYLLTIESWCNLLTWWIVIHNNLILIQPGKQYHSILSSEIIVRSIGTKNWYSIWFARWSILAMKMSYTYSKIMRLVLRTLIHLCDNL